MISVAILGRDQDLWPSRLAPWRALRATASASVGQALAESSLDVLVLVGELELGGDDAARIERFITGGGACIVLGAAIEAFRDAPDLWMALGAPDGKRVREAELIVGNVGHPALRRVERRVALRDHLLPLQALPRDADMLLEVAWQMRRYPVMYTRPFGRGCVIVGTLNPQPTSFWDDTLGRLIEWAACREPKPAVRVGMLGYGAIGREHAEAIAAVEGLELAAVCDRNPRRVAQARELHGDVRAYDDITQLQHDPDLDLVIVSTPPNTHAAMSLELLRSGKHVVVEKPFCLTTAEADELIATAADNRRMLTVYQNRRWDADFLAIREVVAQALLGEIFHVETFIGGYGHPCDYWHSDAAISGGVFYDWGSHYLDWMLTLMPDDVTHVSATAHKRVWHDVTNADHSSIRMRFSGGAEAEFVHSDIAAALKPKWYMLGTAGALVAHWRHETVTSRRWSGDLVEERLQAAEAPSEVSVYRRHAGDVIHEERRSLPTPPSHAFHRNLADHLQLGAPLAVAPAQSRRNIAVMEAATRSVMLDGQWIEPL